MVYSKPPYQAVSGVRGVHPSRGLKGLRASSPGIALATHIVYIENLFWGK